MLVCQDGALKGELLNLYSHRYPKKFLSSLAAMETLDSRIVLMGCEKYRTGSIYQNMLTSGVMMLEMITNKINFELDEGGTKKQHVTKLCHKDSRS